MQSLLRHVVSRHPLLSISSHYSEEHQQTSYRTSQPDNQASYTDNYSHTDTQTQESQTKVPCCKQPVLSRRITTGSCVQNIDTHTTIRTGFRREAPSQTNICRQIHRHIKKQASSCQQPFINVRQAFEFYLKKQTLGTVKSCAKLQQLLCTGLCRSLNLVYNSRSGTVVASRLLLAKVTISKHYV